MYFFFLFILLPYLSYSIDSFEKLLISSPKKSQSSHAITYKLETWRRLGDNITVFCKALFFSNAYHIKLFYKPFPYSDQFALHQTMTLLTPEIEKRYSKIVSIQTLQDLEKNLESEEPILFECHFLTQTPWLYSYSREHGDFEQEIKTLFTPLILIEPLPRPENVVTVALHVRKGGGFDRPLGSIQEYEIAHETVKGFYLLKNCPTGSYTDVWPIRWPAGPKFIEEIQKLYAKKHTFSDYTWPIKFPADQYYIDQLKELTKILPHKNLLVYIFTDDPNPEEIMNRYSKALAEHSRIIFSYRKVGNHHTKNVLEDLFALTQCDCLISASSSFAHAAQLLGNHSITLMPVHAIALPDKIIINKVGVMYMNNALDYKNRKLNYNEIVHKIK